jgi:hypothetical protein
MHTHAHTALSLQSVPSGIMAPEAVRETRQTVMASATLTETVLVRADYWLERACLFAYVCACAFACVCWVVSYVIVGVCGVSRLLGTKRWEQCAADEVLCGFNRTCDIIYCSKGSSMSSMCKNGGALAASCTFCGDPMYGVRCF